MTDQTEVVVRPASRIDEIDAREKAAYAAGLRDAQVDVALQSHEKRLNAINGSIERHAKEAFAQREELSSLRKAVEDVSGKVSAIAGALSITAAVTEDRGKRDEQQREKARWRVGTLVAIGGVIVATGGGLGGIAETLHLLGVL